MASKRRAAKPAANLPEEPARDAAAAMLAPSLFDRVFARLKTLKGAVVAIAGVGAVLGGLAGYWNAYQAARGSTESSKLLALVGKGDAGPLSIVVLPFANLTGDPQQAYLADGLTAAVTSDLSRIRDAFIVSAATAFAYKDKPLTVQQIGKELGVRFALQGGVQRSGEKIRINAQLADTTTDAQLWSESFDGSQGDLFALQEMVTARIGNSIGREMVIVVARDSLTRKSEPNVADLMIRASAENLKPPGKANFARVQALYRQVLDLEANNVQAVVRLAMSLSSEAYDPMQIGDPVAREEQFAEARSLALRAKELGSNDPFVYGVLSDYALEYGDHVGAIRLAETALSLDPKNPRWYSYAGAAYVSSGQPLRGIELLMQGLRLNPKVGAGFSFYLGLANFMLGDNDAAIKWLQKSVDEDPGEPSSYACLAIVYAHIGDQ